MLQLGEKQKKFIPQLKAEKEEHLETISKLKDEVILLNSKLDKMSKRYKQLCNHQRQEAEDQRKSLRE